jgi:hypothetical protein
VTFVDWADLHRWKLINDTLGLDFPEPAETYSSSEHLYSELSIPPDATGKLPVELRARAGLSAEAEEDIGETGRIRSRRGRDRSDGRESTRTRNRTRRRKDSEQDDIGSGSPARSAAGPASGTDDMAEDGTASLARSRRRRRLRAGQEVGQDTGLAPSEPAAIAPGAAAAALPDGTPEGDAREGDARQETTRRRTPRQRAVRKHDADEEAPVRPLAASAPITMPAAPGVPAAIFQAPA